MKRVLIIAVTVLSLLFGITGVAAAAPDSSAAHKAHTTWHLKEPAATLGPTGFSPAQIRSAYKLTNTGSTGTIAIIDAYDDPNVVSDWNTFSTQFGLSTGTLEVHKMSTSVPSDSGWALEISLMWSGRMPSLQMPISSWWRPSHLA